jgi:uncharacterized protein YndB with AHSA1/START domain
MEITRETTVDAPPEAVWDVLADEHERAAWLGDDGADRLLRVDDEVAGERLAWTWWPEEGGAASTVSITLAPTGAGGTLVRVVERLALPLTPRTAHRSAVATSAAWGRRLLGIELLLVLGHARV